MGIISFRSYSLYIYLMTWFRIICETRKLHVSTQAFTTRKKARGADDSSTEIYVSSNIREVERCWCNFYVWAGRISQKSDSAALSDNYRLGNLHVLVTTILWCDLVVVCCTEKACLWQSTQPQTRSHASHVFLHWSLHLILHEVTIWPHAWRQSHS